MGYYGINQKKKMMKCCAKKKSIVKSEATRFAKIIAIRHSITKIQHFYSKFTSLNSFPFVIQDH